MFNERTMYNLSHFFYLNVSKTDKNCEQEKKNMIVKTQGLKTAA